MVVSEETFLRQVRDSYSQPRVLNADTISIIEEKRGKGSAHFLNDGAVDEDLNVQVGQNFAFEDFISKILLLQIIEKEVKLVIVIPQQREAQLRFQIRWQPTIKSIIPLQRLHHSRDITIFDVVDRVVVDIVIQVLV